MKRRESREWTPIRETVDEWIERVGYCFHSPTCTDSAACRVKRAQEFGSGPGKPYTGGIVKPRKLDFEE